MPDIVKNDKEIIKTFRKAAVDGISEIERKALRSRIDKSVTRRGFSRFYPWVAAASVILLLGFAYFLRHTGQNPSPVTPVEMLVVQTQTQEKTCILLPDSTIVWLNANSRLEYPDRFEEDGRNVTLSGEAYFDVVPDASRPFLVHTRALDVRVLGTTFNLTAYDNDTEVVTTLLEGKVGLHLPGMLYEESIILAPDQQAVYRKRDQNFELHTVDTELYTSWIRGYYKFENTSFEQIAKQYGRLYDVTFVFEDEKLKDLSYTGTFLQAQDIESVLELLRNLNDFQYKIVDNQVYISH